MEKNTDWGMRRKGAFREQIIATERCLMAGIAPRWQLFFTKRCLGELDEFLQLIKSLKLHQRCEAIGHKFEVFIGGISPEGNGYVIDDLRPDEDDLRLIPQELLSITREGTVLLGDPEYKLIVDLIQCEEPPNINANFPCVSVNAKYDVYPNIAEPTEWWCLGNLKTDGVNPIIKAYRDEISPGMQVNRMVPICELAKEYGKPNSKKLYHKSDLISRFIHQWGMSYLGGNNNVK